MAIDNFRRVDFTLDKANGYIPSDQFAKENDNNGRELTVQITDGGVIRDQSSLVLTLAWKHNTAGNEGQTLFTRLNGGQGIFTVAYDNAMMIPGTVTACIQIADGSRLTNTRNFKLRIEDNPLNVDKAVAEDSFKVFVEALAGLSKYDGRISALEAGKADYDYVNDRFKTLVDGSPSGSYDTLAELNSAKPQGDNGIYIVLEDGNWYLWDGTKWKPGGVYQSTATADESITARQLSNSALRLFNPKSASEIGVLKSDEKTKLESSSLYSADAGGNKLAFFKNKFSIFQFQIEVDSGTQLILEAKIGNDKFETVNVQLQGGTCGSIYKYDSGTRNVKIIREVRRTDIFVPNDLVTVVKTDRDFFSIYKNGIIWGDVTLHDIDEIEKFNTKMGVLMARTELIGAYASRLIFYQPNDLGSNNGSKTVRLAEENIIFKNTKAKIELNSLVVEENTSSNFSIFEFDAIQNLVSFDVTKVFASNLYLIFANKNDYYRTVQITGDGSGKIVQLNDAGFSYEILDDTTAEPFVNGDNLRVISTDGSFSILKNKLPWKTFAISDYSDKEDITTGLLLGKIAKGRAISNVKICISKYAGKISNKTLGAFGDSITAGFNILNPYHFWIGKKLGFDNVLNAGISGTRISKPDINGESMCTRWQSLPEDLGALVCLFGTNDFGVEGGVPLGTFDSRDNTTFYGATHNMIKGISLKYVGKPMLIVTPLPREGQAIKNAKGFVLSDYVKALEEVCAFYSVTCLNLFESIGINPDTDPSIVAGWTRDGDGLHPNEKYHELLGTRISNALSLQI